MPYGPVSVRLTLSAEYVRDKVLRVYTHGSPPVATLSKSFKKRNSSTRSKEEEDEGEYACEILRAFDLPSDMVYGYVQPYVRIGFMIPRRVPTPHTYVWCSHRMSSSVFHIFTHCIIRTRLFDSLPNTMLSIPSWTIWVRMVLRCIRVAPHGVCDP